MDAQQELKLPISAQQPVIGQQISSQWSGRRRRLIIGSSLLTTASLILVAVLLFTSWHTAISATSHTYHPVLTAHERVRMPLPIPTMQEVLTPQDALMASEVDHLLTDMVTHQQFSGSVLIAHDGQIILSKGYSMADWDQQIPNTPQTKFYLGSTTKQFTAMAILILQEQGKLHVQDQLCTYIVPCPPAWQPVTIHEVLTHTSGIPELDDASLSDASPSAWIASFNSVPLVFTPGGQYDYCSVCYQILGYVVQQVSGEPYSTFLQQAIFNPLQMNSTSFDPHTLSPSDHATGYATWQIKDVSLDWFVGSQWSFLFGSGLLHTTVEDLYRWDQALYTSTLVSQQTQNEAFTPYVPAQYPGSSYGYGWFVAKAPVPGHRLIWHNGRIDGFRTYIGRYVDDQVTIIFLSNLATVDELALAKSLEQIAFAHIET